MQADRRTGRPVAAASQHETSLGASGLVDEIDAQPRDVGAGEAIPEQIDEPPVREPVPTLVEASLVDRPGEGVVVPRGAMQAPAAIVGGDQADSFLRRRARSCSGVRRSIASASIT